MALPNCAVFSFHQTPPANATARIMLTWRMSAIGRRFTADGSATAILAAGAVAAATVVASLGAFSLAASAGVAVTAAESSLASTGFLSVFLSVFSATGTPGTGTDGAACIACADSIGAGGGAFRGSAGLLSGVFISILGAGNTWDRNRWSRLHSVRRFDCGGRCRFQGMRRGPGRLGETVFILWFQRSQHQFGQQAQVANVAVVKSERPSGKRFQYSNYPPPSA